jgi:stage II sporulation protein M
LIRKIFMRQTSTMQFQMLPFLSRYVIFMVVAIGIVTVAASIEAYLSPNLMEAVITKLK